MAGRRLLGGTGIEVGPLALGGNVFGWTADPATSHRVLDAFADAGVSLVDTADVYQTWVPGHRGGESEALLGEWLAKPGNRARVVLATKVGSPMGDGSTGLSQAHIAHSVEQSLRRLRTDHIDLYQAHRDDPSIPLAETLEAFGELIRQGKVRAIGASNYSAERLSEALGVSRAHGLPRFETLQPHYNLIERKAFEDSLEAVCVREHLGVIPYFALASGFLTGKYRSADDVGKSQRGDTVLKYLDERGHRVLRALDAVADETRSTPARVALAWLMARPSITAPIASATGVEQCQDLIEATRLELSADAVKLLDLASA